MPITLADAPQPPTSVTIPIEASGEFRTVLMVRFGSADVQSVSYDGNALTIVKLPRWRRLADYVLGIERPKVFFIPLSE